MRCEQAQLHLWTPMREYAGLVQVRASLINTLIVVLDVDE